MPLTLYPAVDIQDGRAVRLVQGLANSATVYDEDPVAAARRWAEQGAEWLHVVDLNAAFCGEPRNRHLIAAIVEATDVPVQASGGIRSLEDLDASIRYGASRVVIGTMALECPSFVAEAVNRYGEKVAVGLDADGATLRARGWTTLAAGPRHPVICLRRLRASVRWGSPDSCLPTSPETGCWPVQTSTVSARLPRRPARVSPRVAASRVSTTSAPSLWPTSESMVRSSVKRSTRAVSALPRP
jgi:hypothetical protein